MKIDQSVLYELYKRRSADIHSSNAEQRAIYYNKKGNPEMLDIRSPDDAQQTTMFTISFIRLAYESYFKARIPEYKKQYNKWFQDNNFPRILKDLEAKEYIQIKED